MYLWSNLIVIVYHHLNYIMCTLHKTNSNLTWKQSCPDFNKYNNSILFDSIFNKFCTTFLAPIPTNETCLQVAYSRELSESKTNQVFPWIPCIMYITFFFFNNLILNFKNCAKKDSNLKFLIININLLLLHQTHAHNHCFIFLETWCL